MALSELCLEADRVGTVVLLAKLGMAVPELAWDRELPSGNWALFLPDLLRFFLVLTFLALLDLEPVLPDATLLLSSTYLTSSW